MPDLPKAYWFGQVSSSPFSEIPIVCLEFSTDTFSPERHNAVWQRLIRRHEMLRAVIRPDGMFEILEEVPEFQLTVTDLRETSPVLASLELERIAEALLSRPRSIDRWPLFDIHALRLPNGLTRLLFSFCTFIFDGFCWSILKREANALYRDPSAELAPRPLGYPQYAETASGAEAGLARKRAFPYWEERFASMPSGPPLPAPRSQGPKRWHHTEFRLSFEWSSAFNQTARALGVSKTALANAAFAETIAVWSKSRHFVLTLLVHARPSEYAHVVGNFGGTLALEVDFRGASSFRERARELNRRFLQDLEHRAVSGIQVAREINRLRGRPPTALFPVAFSASWGRSKQSVADEWSCTGIYVRRRLRVPDVSLDVGIFERDGGVECHLDARADLFPDGFLSDFFMAFRQLLLQLAAGPQFAERSRPVLPPPKDRALYLEVNQTQATHDERLLHELFLEQAVRRPAAIAVIARERTLTYGELQKRSAALAHRLRALGVGRNQLVAVAMHRGWQQAVAVLAIHRAGAGYVPIDLSLVPRERAAHILRHAEVRVAITQPDAASALEWPAGVNVLTVEEASTGGMETTAEAAWARALPEDVAYVIYTSGSTGLPKGVTIDHRGAVNTVLDINRRFSITEHDRVIALSSLAFDLSVWDIFGTFACGGVLVIPPASERPDPAVWVQVAREHEVTVWNSVPKLLEIAIEHIGERREMWPPSLRLAMLSGDWIPLSLPDRARALSAALQIVSLGGATEASIWSIYFEVGAIDPLWQSIPYGRPLTNQTFYVLDNALVQRPVWVTGELYIGGSGLAKGYWRDPEKTRERFIVHPESGERLYRTGDLGRYLPDGNIEFLGREDSQVKVRGYRVELGEIESVLMKLPGIRSAYVLAREAAAERAVERRRRASDHASSRGGGHTVEKQLVAYLIPDTGVPVDLVDVRARVAEKVPEYMVPTHFVALKTSEIPRSANGKVDRRALPPPEADPGAVKKQRAPSDALELKLHALFANTLGAQGIGIDDSFFELGGDSVMLVRLLSRIRKEYGLELGVASFAADPRISGVARLLRERREVQPPDRALVPIRPDGDRRALFLVHPVGGSALAYLALARHLEPGRPLYALQARGLESEQPPLATIEEMASAYLAEVRAAQPEGPYLLGGWSLGGTIAFEMAGQVHDQGEQAVVLMIDSWAPQGLGGSAPVADAVLLDWFRRDVSRVGQLEHGTFVPELDPEGLPPSLRRQFAVYRTNIRAVRSYVPRARPIRTALIRAATLSVTFADHPVLRNPLLEDPALGWQSLTSQLVDVCTSPGDHYSMFAADHVAALAVQVDQCARRLDPIPTSYP
jgi:amino acid adenylation domain-containing protein